MGFFNENDSLAYFEILGDCRPGGGGGTCQNFDTDARPIFWV